MENVDLAAGSNVVSIEARKQNIPFLTLLGKSDPDVKEFVRLIHRYSLREKAVTLLNKKLAVKKPTRPVFFR